MNLNARGLIDQGKQILTMNCGLLLMADMVNKNALWVSKLLISEENKLLNALMERN